MADPTMSVQATVETAQFEAGMRDIAKSLGITVDKQLELIKTNEKLNASGEVTARTYKVQIDALNTLVVTYKKVSAAAAEAAKAVGAVPISVKGGPDLFAAQANLRTKTPPAQKIQQALNPADVAAGFAAQGQVSRFFPAPSTATIAQLSRYQTEISKIQALLASGKVSGSRFQEIFQAFKSGDLNKLSLNAPEQRILSSLNNINAKFKSTKDIINDATDKLRNLARGTGGGGDPIGPIAKGLKTADDNAKSFGLTLENIFRIGQVLAFKAALDLIIGQMQQGVKSAIDFQIKISEIRTLSTENQSSFEGWSASIAKVSDSLGIPQIEVAKAGYEALSAQIVNSREETEKFTLAAGNLARVGVSSITESGKTLAAIFNAYGISANRAEEISAKLFVAVDRGNFTIEQLNNHMGRVTGAASAMGISFEETLGALTTLSRTSNPADAITQLTNVILKLQRPGEVLKSLFKSWNVESGQMAIETFRLTGVMQKLQDAIGGDAAVLAEFGQELRAIRGITGLTQGGKGKQFQDDIKAITDENTVDKFRGAVAIRGESAGDQITRLMNRLSNFFTNEFGQKLINNVVALTSNVDDLFKVIKNTVDVVGSAAKVITLYVVGTQTAAVLTNLFSGSMTRLGFSMTVAEAAAKKTNAQLGVTKVQLTGAGIAANAFSSALSGAAKVAAAGFLLLEIKAYARELDNVVKKSEEFENVLKRTQAAREGKTPEGNKALTEKFNENMLKESANFGNTVDNLFKPLLLKQTQTIEKTKENFNIAKDEGKEAAIQLSLAFKETTDAIGNTAKKYAEKITEANKVLTDSKKNILGIKESLASLINDLKMDFASENQKFALRAQEIQRLESEARKLGESNDPVDLAKAQQLGLEALRQRKEFAKLAGDAEVEAEKRRRTAAGRGEGSQFPDNRPIQPNLAPHIEGMEETAAFVVEINKKAITVAEKTKKTNEELIKQEKERERLATKRLQDLLKFQLVNDEGKIKKEFLTPTGKLDETKFTNELNTQLEAVNKTLTAEEKKLIGINELEKFRLSLIKEAQAAVEVQAATAKQQAISTKAAETKQKFEEASKERIGASANVDKALKELNVFGDVMRGMTDRARSDNSWKTIGVGENKFQEAAQTTVRILADGINEIRRQWGSTPLNISDRQQVLDDNQDLVREIGDLQNKFASMSAKAAGRDQTGKLTGTEADIQAAEKARQDLAMKMNYFLQKFTGQLDNADMAAPGGLSLKESNKVAADAFATLRDAIQSERAAQGRQEVIVAELRQAFTPAQIALAEQTTQIRRNIDALVGNTTGLLNFTNTIQNALANIKQPVPQNIPQPQAPFIPGKHLGGMIHGPSGYDNLLIRAEAGEFIMRQSATKKWLPQLIAMNNGLNPKIPGRYHEGGLVQTNVGDVNVTITGPVSPEKNVRQIGNALRRSIRRGNLDLTSKR